MIWIILYSIIAVICFVGYLVYCVKDNKILTLLDTVAAFVIAVAWIISLFFFIIECGDNIVIWRKK